MNSKKFTMLASVIAVAMMLCVAITPMVSFDSNVSATDGTDEGVTTPEGTPEETDEGTDYDTADMSGIMELITATGLMEAISSVMTRTSYEFGETVEVKEPTTIKEVLDLTKDKGGKYVSLKFTENGKYVIEAGASVILCEALALEGKGTIFEMKAGSFIKFTSDAEGYQLTEDTVISLSGTYKSQLKITPGTDKTSNTITMSVDLKGTLKCGDLEIVNDSENMFKASLALKAGIKAPALEIAAFDLSSIVSTSVDFEFTANIKSVTATVNSGDSDQYKIVFSNINAKAKVSYADGDATVEAEGGMSVETNGITVTPKFNVKLNVSGLTLPGKEEAVPTTAEIGETLPDTDAIEFSGSGDISLKVVSKDKDGKDVSSEISVKFNIADGKYAGNSFSAKITIDNLEIKTDVIEASGVKAYIELEKTAVPETSKIMDIMELVQPGSYVDVESVTIKTDSIYAKVTKAKMSLVENDDKVRYVNAEIGTLNLNGKISGYDKTTIEMSNVKVNGTLDGDKITVSGDKILCDMKPLMSKNMHISGENFTAEKDDKKVTLKSGTYVIEDAISFNAKMVISKDAKVTVNAITFGSGALTIESGNTNINGKFTIAPGAEYNYGADKNIIVNDLSKGYLTVTMASGVQTLAIEPVSVGYTLTETKEGLAYTVNEDGTGTFTDTEPNGTLCAMCEPKKFKVTFGDDTPLEVEYSVYFEFPAMTKTEEGKVFLGWTDGYRTYRSGESAPMPAKNITFTAVWSDTGYNFKFDDKGKTYSVTKDTAESLLINADDITKMIEEIKKDNEVTFDIKTDSFTVSFDSKAAIMFDDELSITVKQVKTENISDDVVYAVEDGALYTIDATCGISDIHDFYGGTAKVTVTYELKDGQKASDLTGYYLNTYSTATLEPVETSVKDLGNGKVEVTMTLNHFSDYIVKEKATPASSDEGSSGDNGMSLGVTAGVIVAIIAILAIAGVVLMKRKG